MTSLKSATESGFRLLETNRRVSCRSIFGRKVYLSFIAPWAGQSGLDLVRPTLSRVKKPRAFATGRPN